MTRISWRQLLLAVPIAVLAVAPSAWAQTEPGRPDDATPPFAGKEDPDVSATGAEKDDPTSRLEWQRGAWGVVTPSFRALAIAEGKRHNDKKNAPGPKWVSIGPTGADFEQNGSFTGHVRDSGRARTVLPHPTDANVVYFLTSGGGLWRTDNWNAASTTWRVLTDDLPTTGGGAVAFGRNPNTLYLGLGDPFDQILVGGSMTKSKNGGNTWEPIVELGSAVSVRDVKVDTSTNRDIVLVATDSGLYRSADEGATYSAIAHLRRHVGVEHRAHQRRLARLRPALPGGRRRPPLRPGDDALPLHRPRRHVEPDQQRRQRLQQQRPHDAGRRPCPATASSTPTPAPSPTRRCGTSTARPTAARPGSPTT